MTRKATFRGQTILLLTLALLLTAFGGGKSGATTFSGPPAGRDFRGSFPAGPRLLVPTALRRKTAGESAVVGNVSILKHVLVGRMRLITRLLSDVVAAGTASLMVSPFISIVDRSIIQSASGTLTVRASVHQGLRVLTTKPALFMARPDFICTWCLYGATYLAANAISTIADEIHRSDAWPKFLGTTAINMPGSIAKDQALTKLFGVVGGAAKVPAASFALFTVRDVATMAAAFTLPTPMSAKVLDPMYSG